MQDQTEATRPADILIVDDAPENLDVLIEILGHAAYHIRPVTSAQAAWQAARKKPPDAILLDIHMPDMDGLTLCVNLKKDDRLKDTPVIFISGTTGPEEVKKVFAAGAADYIIKPFQPEEVRARVQTQTELRALRLELALYKKKYTNLQSDQPASPDG